jgi:hypothetical protein
MPTTMAMLMMMIAIKNLPIGFPPTPPGVLCGCRTASI